MAETLSEQVAELERERDTLRLRFDGLRDSLRQSQQRVHELVEAKADSDQRLSQAREAGAREAGAREAQAAFVAGALWADREVPADTLNTPMAEAEARRRYPALPSERGEEPKCGVCKDTRKVFDPVKSFWTWCRECQSHPPQAAPEPLEVVARSPLGSVFTLTLTPADCRRIVALASRPTASGEG